VASLSQRGQLVSLAGAGALVWSWNYMSRPEPLNRLSASAEAVEIVRATLQRIGLSLPEPDARRVAEAVLAIEGPRLQRQVRGTFENSLEIIRDTAEAALGGVKEKRVERSDLLGGGRGGALARRPPPPPLDIDDDDPRPVFKRPRR
jgi:hypothetical protein